MRKVYIDNIRWITVALVVIYHVIYMFNGVETAGVIGPFVKSQYQDVYLYMVYPWFMLLLFVVSGMCARFCLEGCLDKAFLKKRTQKLLVPSTIGLFVFQWILGYYNMMLWLFSVILVVIRKLEKDRLYSKCEKAPVWLLLLFTIVAYGAWCTTKGKHIFGMVKVGEKGQIVIPAKARKLFDIKPGDNLIILGDEGQGIAIIKEKGLVELLGMARKMQ